MPVASVVITTRNRCDELVDAVRSALNQSVPVEVLVIDDGSTDGTAGPSPRTTTPPAETCPSVRTLGFPPGSRQTDRGTTDGTNGPSLF